MKKFITILLLFALALPSAAAASPSPSPSPPGGDPTAALMDKLHAIVELVQTVGLNSGSGDDPIANALYDLFKEDPKFFDTFLETLLSHYDKFSHYIPAGMHERLYPSGEAYVGIGVILDSGRRGGLFVESVVPSSPADKAKLLPGDQIIRIDSQDTEFSRPEQAVSKIRGAEGAPVKITVRRQGASLELTLTREYIKLPTVHYKDMGDGVGYLGVDQFADLATFGVFAERYTNMSREGVRSVIIDLRDNPGGELGVLVSMLNYVVVDPGTLMFTVSGQGGNSDVLRSAGYAEWRPNKIVILVNEHTASASEVFAGVLKDLGYAELVGIKTYGKGYGQNHMVFKDDSAAVVTNLEVTLPRTGTYSGVGISPDYVVPMGEEAYPMPVLGTLDLKSEISAKSDGDKVLALEQRLSALGYLGVEPDQIFDKDTLWALHAFQHGHSFYVSDVANTTTLTALEKDIQALKASKLPVDTQLEKAMELARAAASKPLASPPRPRDPELYNSPEPAPIEKSAALPLPENMDSAA
ncbi:hypothetical protein FACS1894171_0430 [Clostridia bacterium]|nr:hypothetical protein FACS1894171_0430 [Clostridia bacterium]